MSDSSGQAAGLAVGAAVATVASGGTLPVAAAIGTAAGSLFATAKGYQSDVEALKLNQLQYEKQAAELSARHAQNFRRSLASTMALATMRGGSGSLALQFGTDAYDNFLADQRAIATGLKLQDLKTELGYEDASLKATAQGLKTIGSTAQSVFTGLNLSK